MEATTGMEIKKKRSKPYQGLSFSKFMKTEYKVSDKQTQYANIRSKAPNKMEFSGILTPARNII